MLIWPYERICSQCVSYPCRHMSACMCHMGITLGSVDCPLYLWPTLSHPDNTVSTLWFIQLQQHHRRLNGCSNTQGKQTHLLSIYIVFWHGMWSQDPTAVFCRSHCVSVCRRASYPRYSVPHTHVHIQTYVCMWRSVLRGVDFRTRLDLGERLSSS